MYILAELLADLRTIFLVVGVLMTWTAISAHQLYRGTHRLIVILQEARSAVEAESEPRGFFRNFETVAQQLTACLGPLSPVWASYRETLILPEGSSSQVIRSTVRPEAVFDLGLLRAVELRPRYHAALPGMLVGAGLLFTFLGLAVGLSVASGVVAESDLEASRRGLHTLLETASFKFLTSLAGLALSIAYTIFRNGRIRRVDQALDGLNAALERQMPLATPAFLQHEANEVLRQQGASLDTFGTELALNIGRSLDSAFDQRLGEHIGPLREAIEALANRTSSQNEDAVTRMLERFTEQLTGGTRDHLAGVTENLSSLGLRLEALQGGLGDASVRMAQAADDMARRMGDGAEAALGRITDQMSGLMEMLRGVAAQTRDAGADAAQLLGSRIEAAAAGIEMAAAQMTERFTAAAANTGEALSHAAAGSGAALAAGADDAAKHLHGAASAIRDMLETTGQGLARQATALGAAAEAVAVRIEALDRAARDAIAPLAAGAADLREAAAAAQGATSPLRLVASSLETTVAQIGDAGQGFVIAQAGAERLSNDIAAAAQRFEGVDRALGETLRGLGSGVDEFRLSVERMVSTTDQNLARAAQYVSTMVAELSDTLEAFGMPRSNQPAQPQPS